jgi:hypothetical protein
MISIELATTIAASVTAAATIVLCCFTNTLSKETKRMAEATSQPHVVATIILNKRSFHHFDIQVDNTGNATAYDISIEFEKTNETEESIAEDVKIPFQYISVLKPNQTMTSYLSEYQKLKGKVYDVHISWKRKASDEERQYNSYTLSMTDYEAITQLGNDPLIDIEKHLKSIERNLSSISRSKNS